jgi:ABC-type amino acid transport substrate-binding protein
MTRMNQLLLGIWCCIIIISWYSFFRKTAVIKNQDPDIVLVGVSPDYPPFVYEKDGQLYGFDIDVMREIAHRLSKRVDFQSMPFTSLIPQIQLGTIHAIIGGLMPTRERSEKMLFTRSYFSGDPLVIATHQSRQDTIKHVKDLAHKRVAVNEGYTADLYITQFPDIIIERYATPAESFLALQSNRVTAFVTAESSVKQFLELYGAGTFAVAIIPETEEAVAIAISKGYEALHEKIDRTIESMLQDGSIKRLIRKWKLRND